MCDLSIDDVTLAYLRLTGRPERQVSLVEAYSKEQGLWHDPPARTGFSQALELDLSSVEPSIAGPKRPQDRIPLSRARHTVRALLTDRMPPPTAPIGLDEASSESFPASDSVAVSHDHAGDQPTERDHLAQPADWPSEPVLVTLDDGTTTTVDHGHVVIAAITSCTNTSNPTVMLGAGLLAKNAVDRGLAPKPWVKTSLAPGSRVVTDYLRSRGLDALPGQTRLLLVGYGCTTCIGNSGPLISRNQRSRGRARPDGVLGAIREPQLRGADPSRMQDELPCFSAACHRVRPCRLHCTPT